MIFREGFPRPTNVKTFRVIYANPSKVFYSDWVLKSKVASLIREIEASGFAFVGVETTVDVTSDFYRD
ncbi:hypothetical protein D3C71_1116320 [compost metagenome]